MQPDTHDISVRVRYCEADPMGFLHHAQYFAFFEMGRMELFRAQGGDYRDMERRGYFMVVVHAECDFKAPARFDDVLTVRTRIVRVSPAKMEHAYEVLRGEQLLAKAKVILACVNREGQVQRMDDAVLFGESKSTEGIAN